MLYNLQFKGCARTLLQNCHQTIPIKNRPNGTGMRFAGAYLLISEASRMTASVRTSTSRLSSPCFVRFSAHGGLPTMDAALAGATLNSGDKTYAQLLPKRGAQQRKVIQRIWARCDSNARPPGYQPGAPPAMLRAPVGLPCNIWHLST